MEGTVICKRIYVDCWKLSNSKKCCYFLSQVLPDIDADINSSWKFPIYSSVPNLKALACFTNVDRNLLRPLSYQQKTFITIGNFNFHVTMINSYSLTGSVIYHFFCDDKEYIYFGKMNITSYVMYNPYLMNLGKDTVIDTLIIDTSLAHTPVDFSIESAAEQIETILSENLSRTVVLSTPTFGIEDLLLEVASRGFSVYAGYTRSTFLKFQNADQHFTKSKYARLRPVHKCHCENIEDCYRRYVQKDTLTIIPSAFYTLEEVNYLKKVGIHIIYYADRTTPRALYHLIKTIKPIKLRSSSNKLDIQLLKPYLKLCRKLHVSPRPSMIFRDFKVDHDFNMGYEGDFLNNISERNKTPDLEKNLLNVDEVELNESLNGIKVESDISETFVYSDIEVPAGYNESKYTIETKSYFNHKQPSPDGLFIPQSLNESNEFRAHNETCKKLINKSTSCTELDIHPCDKKDNCVVLLKRLRNNQEDEMLTPHQKKLKTNNERASKKLSSLAIPVLEQYQKMHLFTKHKLQFMEDNFIDPVEMSKNLYRFHIKHHLSCINKLKSDMAKIEENYMNKL